MKTFREITVGGLVTESLIQRLVDAGVQFNQYAEVLFDHAAFSPGQRTEKVELIKVKLSDLNLGNPCSYQAIVDRALSLGLKLCPLYLGAFLRLAYSNQPEGPYLTIASSELENDESYPTGFYIRNFDKTLWLRGYQVIGDADWPLDNEFIFLK